MTTEAQRVQLLLKAARELLRLAEQLAEDTNIDIADTATAHPSVRVVQRSVCKAFNVQLADMVSKAKYTEIVLARQAAMAICAELLPMGAREIAKNFRVDMDHGTVRCAIRRTRDELQTHPAFKAAYTAARDEARRTLNHT